MMINPSIFCLRVFSLVQRKHSVSSLILYRRLTHPSETKSVLNPDTVTVCEKEYVRDDFTNVTPRILQYVGRNIHLKHNHPLNLLQRRLVNFMYAKYVNNRGNPLFSVYCDLSPVVTPEQTFDSLLIPKDHVSRKKSDTYYVNRDYVLRPHTSAHQKELLHSGLDNFLVIGDVFRRDEINSTHFPVFHQAEGVRIFSKQQLFWKVPDGESLTMFAEDVRRAEKQECHSLEAVKVLEADLKDCLLGLVHDLFGSDIEHKWTDSYFPFTHPSWELEILWEGKWLEVLGCGIIEQKILSSAGAGDKVGWAFGLGLERLAMLLYSIPDIRLFWSNDSGFLSQFDVQDPYVKIKYKPVSRFPQCINDTSFWIPKDFHVNEFYEIVRSIGGDIVEQVYKIDEFFHPKHQKHSLCFRIVYRHMERTLTQDEVTVIHRDIKRAAVKELNVELRGF